MRNSLPLDLHVLGTPPAFILSQDQTLQKENADNFFEITFKGVNIDVDVALLNF